jgi:uncharacterized membrane protein YkoI
MRNRAPRLLSRGIAIALAGMCVAEAGPIPERSMSPAPDQPPTAFVAQRRGGISLAQATSMALSRYKGRVVRAEQITVGDRVVYEIRILGEDGRVHTVRIDAQTGAFL